MSNSFATPWTVHKGFPSDLVKHPPTSAGDRRDRDLIPASGRSPGGEMATHSSVLAWKIPWTEEPGRLQPIELQRLGRDWARTCLFFIDSTAVGYLQLTELQRSSALETSPFLKPLSVKWKSGLKAPGQKQEWLATADILFLHVSYRVIFPFFFLKFFSFWNIPIFASIFEIS